MHNGKIIGLFLLVFLFINISLATSPIISIDESSSVVKLLNGNYKISTQGIITIHNPSTTATINEFRIDLFLDSLLGISKVNIDESSNNFVVNYDKIYGYILQPQQKYKFGYKLYGIMDYNIYSKTNDSVLEYYMEDLTLVPDLIINLQKPEREAFNTTNVSRRLVSYGIFNPTDFNFLVRDIKLYRNVVNFNDTSPNSGVFLKSSGGFSILGNDNKILDFFDVESVDNSIYWVVSDVVIDNINFYSDFTRRFTEERKGSGGSSSGSSGGFYLDLNESYDEVFDVINTDFIIRKRTDKTIVQHGDTTEIILNLVNLNNFAVSDVEVIDSMPDGYTLVNISNEVIINGDKLIFKNLELERYEDKIITYNIINTNKYRGVTYLKPAQLIYNETFYFSDGIILINEMLPDKKVYVQKEIKAYNDDYMMVIIKVKNLGTSYIKDLLITENFDNSTIVKQISKPFYSYGAWKISELTPNEEWEVSFLVPRDSGIVNNFPNVYGVESDTVFKSLISTGQIISYYKDNSSIFEKVGLVFAVGLLVVYLLF